MEAEQKQEFDKAFEAAMSDEEIIEDVKVPEEPAAPVEEPAIIEEPVTSDRVEVVPGYTQEELQESLAQIPKLKKALDTSYGTFGKKIAELDEIIAKHKSKAGDDQTETNAKGVTLDALKQEYPDIAELLAKDLQGGKGDDVLKVVETKFAEERAAREDQRGPERVRCGGRGPGGRAGRPDQRRGRGLRRRGRRHTRTPLRRSATPRSPPAGRTCDSSRSSARTNRNTDGTAHRRLHPDSDCRARCRQLRRLFRAR